MSTRPMATPPRAGSFLASLAIQARVIQAVIMRELHTRYGRENVGYLWMVGEPMILASVIATIHSNAAHPAYGGDITPLPFTVIGYTVFILFRGIVNRSDGALEANAPLLYHRQVTVFDITLARAILEFAGTLTTFTILMSLFIAVGWAQFPARPLALLGAWILMFWYALGHSFVITAMTYENRTVGRLVHPYSYFMVGLSGSFFMMGWLPHPFREWLTWVPMTSIFELARYGQFRSCTLDYFFPQYLIGACMVLTWWGLVAMRRMREHVHLS